jgi:subtilisin family serine protease
MGSQPRSVRFLFLQSSAAIYKLGRFALISIVVMTVFLLQLGPAALAASSTPTEAQKAGAERLQKGEAAVPEYVPGQVMVKFRSEKVPLLPEMFKNNDFVRGILEKIGPIGKEDTFLLDLRPGISVEGAIDALSLMDGVIFAEPNYIQKPSYVPSDPDYPKQWGLNNTGQNIEGQVGTVDADIDAPEAWDLDQGNSNPVTVAVIDSGIDLQHPDLVNQLWRNTDEISGNGIDDDGNGYIDDINGYNWAGISQWTVTDIPWYFGKDGTQQKFAQSITGTGQALSQVGFFLATYGSPTGSITVSLRANDLEAADLATYTISHDEVSATASMIQKNLSATATLTSGSTYYLIVETTNSDASNYYLLYDDYNAGATIDVYREGMEYSYDGASWFYYSDSDLVFITNGNCYPRDDNGHGTHCSGIIGAQQNNQGIAGVSRGVKIMPLKCGDCGAWVRTDSSIQAIYYAVENGARVINMSFGSPFTQAQKDALDYARGHGVVPVAAVGNYGDATIRYPAGYEGVIGVGATDNRDQRWSSSCFNSSVDLTAPGQDIYSTLPTYPVAMNSEDFAEDYDYCSGTSMAAPYVCGLAALILSKSPGLSAAQVETVMETTAEDLGTPGYDVYYGYGRINAYRAIRSLIAGPYIDSLSSTSGSMGDKITINGSGFGTLDSSCSVSFGTASCTKLWSWSDTRIECSVPMAAIGQVEVKVNASSGTSNGIIFNATPATWYLAEGCTGGDFETWVLVQNPLSNPVDINIVFQTDTGTVQGPLDSIPASSRKSYNVGSYVKTYNVSTQVTPSGGNVICERSMYGNDRKWGHDSIGVTSPASSWYLAEGCTGGDFETWVLVQNPGDSEVQVDLDFQTDSGQTQGPQEIIPARSRRSYNVGNYVKTYNISTKVTASGGVICERAMYGGSRTWGHDSVGVTESNSFWCMPEGCTDGDFETWVLVQNPNDDPAEIEMSFQTDKGVVAGPKEVIAPRSRRSYNAANYVRSYDVSTVVNCTSGSVICERAMYGGSRTWGHDSVGSTYSAPTWCMAEGCTEGSFETWVLVQNPADSPADIAMTFMTEKGIVAGPTETIPAYSRKSYNLANYVKSYDVSTLVNAASGSIICERAMYGNNRTWGSDSIGYAP